MSFNKKILALAIVGALPGASFAVVNLQTGATVPVYAQELTVPGVNLDNFGGVPAPFVPATGVLGVTTQLGFSVVGSSKYVRLDFPDTQLATALTSANFTTIGAIPATITISAGGAVGSSFVIVELAAASLSNLDTFHFTPPAAATITPQSKAPHTITYRLYNSPVDAVTNNPALALATASGTWYTFAKGLDLSCASANSLKIDVTNPIDFVGGGNTTDLFSLTANLLDTDSVTPGIQPVLAAAGTPIALVSYLPVGSTFKVTGNFSFLDPAGALEFLPGFTNPIDFATTQWIVGGLAPLPGLPAVGFTSSMIDLTSNNVNAMIAGDYSLLVTPAVGALDVTPINLGVCGSLAYSGSSDRVDYGLTPGAGNKQYLRITNPTPTSGAVNVSVWNDAGVQVDFPLSAVKVGAAPGVNLPAVLNALASTPIIDVNAFDAAAKSVNPGFSVGTGIDGKPGKIRIEVRGAFGDDHVDGVHSLTLAGVLGKPSTSRLKQGIYIQAINNGNFHQSH